MHLACIHFIAGVAGGMSCTLVEHPFDTVKVLLQADKQNLYRGSAWRCTYLITKTHGLSGLYAGLSARLWVSGIEHALLFSVYSSLLQFLNSFTPQHFQSSSTTPPPPQWSNVLLAGGLTGVCSGLCLVPFELLKCQMQGVAHTPGGIVNSFSTPYSPSPTSTSTSSFFIPRAFSPHAYPSRSSLLFLRPSPILTSCFSAPFLSSSSFFPSTCRKHLSQPYPSVPALSSISQSKKNSWRNMIPWISSSFFNRMRKTTNTKKNSPFSTTATTTTTILSSSSLHSPLSFRESVITQLTSRMTSVKNVLTKNFLFPRATRFSIHSVYHPCQLKNSRTRNISMHLHSHHTNTPATVSLGQVAADIFKRKGIRGFFRGGVGTMLREISGTAAWLGGYEMMRYWFEKKKEKNPKDSALSSSSLSPSLSPWETILSGGASGVLFWTVSFPADVVKTRQQVERPSTCDTPRSRGGDERRGERWSTPAVAVAAHPSSSSTSRSHSTGSRAWQTWDMFSAPRDHHPAVGWRSGGGTPPLFSCFARQAPRSVLQEGGFLSTVREVYREGGVLKFYSGWTVTVMRSFPSNAVLFYAYEEIKNALEHFFPPPPSSPCARASSAPCTNTKE